jgi:hypothetical protein
VGGGFVRGHFGGAGAPIARGVVGRSFPP